MLEAFPDERVQRPDADRTIEQILRWLTDAQWRQAIQSRAKPMRYTDVETPGTVNVDPSRPASGPPSVPAGVGGALGRTAAKSALAGVSGLPALFGNRGPSAQENAYTQQATRLLGQQEQRSQFQNPLFEAITRLAYSLQPQGGTQGSPFPYAGLSDVNVPGLEDLMNAQRTAQRR